MVGTAVEIVLPGPIVFQGHELVDVNLMAADQPLVTSIDLPRRTMMFRQAMLTVMARDNCRCLRAVPRNGSSGFAL